MRKAGTLRLDQVSAEEISSYIADMSAELQAMARANGLTVLACILNLANAEADRIAREAKSRRPE